MSSPLAAGPAPAPSLHHDPADDERRRLLLAAAGVVGGAGLIATAYPFVASFAPSERALAAGAPVELDAATVAPGQLRTVEWRGKPVWVMRRTPEMVAALEQPNPTLVDPDSKRSEQPADCRNATRSLQPELFVCVGICTHLGCSPTLVLGNDEFAARMHGPGGFNCPCHGSRFDLAGRVVENVPAPTNLDVPPYALGADGRLRIG